MSKQEDLQSRVNNMLSAQSIKLFDQLAKKDAIYFHNPIISEFASWGRMNIRADVKESDKAIALAQMNEIKASRKVVPVVEKKVLSDKASLLKELGFGALHKQVERIADRAMKENLIALAGYTKILREAFDKARLATEEKSDHALSLTITDVGQYLGQSHEEGNDTSTMSVPPVEVLQKMAEAKKQGVFDSYAVIHVCRAPVADPILVGQINGSDAMYFIAEWGNDISLAELV